MVRQHDAIVFPLPVVFAKYYENSRTVVVTGKKPTTGRKRFTVPGIRTETAERTMTVKLEPSRSSENAWQISAGRKPDAAVCRSVTAAISPCKYSLDRFRANEARGFEPSVAVGKRKSLRRNEIPRVK